MGLYIICTSARTGGNLLCSTLAKINKLGKPGSYAYAYAANEVLNKLNKKEFEEYLKNIPERLELEKRGNLPLSNDLSWLYETNILKNLGSPIERLRFYYDHLKADNMRGYLENIQHSILGGENWGIKILAYDNTGKGFDYFLNHLNQSSPNEHKKHSIQILKELFGEVKFIWLTRRNKIRQGLSRWKAVNTRTWHQYQKEIQDSVNEKLPSIEELNEYALQLTLDDAYWEEFFTKNQVVPLTLVYEDFIQNPEKTIRSILNWLEIKPKKPKYFNGFSQYKLANSNSDHLIEIFYNNSCIL